MKVLPLGEAKRKLSGLVERVSAHHEEIMITRKGRPAAVLISLEEFERWKETLAISENKSLMREIQSGLKFLRVGRAKRYTLDELLAKDRAK